MSSQQQYSIKSTNSGVSVETAHTQYDSEKYTSDIKRRELYKRFLTWIGSGEIEPGMETISYPSYFGKIQRLISYNPENIRHFLAMFASSDLTVFNSFSRWFYNLGWVAYALVIMMMFSLFYFPDGEFENEQEPCSGVQNENVCGLSKLLIDAKADFRFLISFLLAGFVGISLTYWQARRKTYYTCIANSRNLIMLLASNISIENLHHTKTLCRWIRLAFEIGVLDARGGSDTSEARKFLVYQDFLISGEWDCMTSGERFINVIMWIKRELYHLKKETNIEEFSTIISSLSQFKENLSDLKSTTGFLPFPYVHIIGLLVKMNLFIYASAKGSEWSIWYFQYGHKLFDHDGLHIYVDMVILFMWSISYAAVFDLGYTLNNPFMDRRFDIPHEKESIELDRFIDMMLPTTRDEEQIPPSSLLYINNQSCKICDEV